MKQRSEKDGGKQDLAGKKKPNLDQKNFSPHLPLKAK
jgi:hypothetical protein